MLETARSAGQTSTHRIKLLIGSQAAKRPTARIVRTLRASKKGFIVTRRTEVPASHRRGVNLTKHLKAETLLHIFTVLFNEAILTYWWLYA